MIPALLLLLACTGSDKPSGGDPPGPADGGSTTDGGSTGTALWPIPTYACPGPPDDAIVFTTGTVQAEQIFYSRPTDRTLGWAINVFGVSFEYEDTCGYAGRGSPAFVEEVKAGTRPGAYHYELQVTAPAREVGNWPGLFGGGNNHLYRQDMPAARVNIGWNDGKYHWVSSLPHGMTEMTVCIGTLSPDYVYLTVLWEPSPDGPYPVNERNPMDQPIWFDVEMFAYDSHDEEPQRNCLSTGYGTKDLKGQVFGGYDWPGRDDDE
ncbi:hypothetical protein L6R53_15320 [Myxococcota bacterium]|nr:hypothetical protein [Myxococcota bacterium]